MARGRSEACIAGDQWRPEGLSKPDVSNIVGREIVTELPNSRQAVAIAPLLDPGGGRYGAFRSASRFAFRSAGRPGSAEASRWQPKRLKQSSRLAFLAEQASGLDIRGNGLAPVQALAEFRQSGFCRDLANFRKQVVR